MTETTVVDFTKPSDISSNPLTDVLHQGAWDLLAAAVQAEATGFIAAMRILDEVGRHGRFYRNGK